MKAIAKLAIRSVSLDILHIARRNVNTSIIMQMLAVVFT